MSQASGSPPKPCPVAPKYWSTSENNDLIQSSWEPSPSDDPRPKEVQLNAKAYFDDILHQESKHATCVVGGTFAVDQLDSPLQCWANKILGLPLRLAYLGASSLSSRSACIPRSLAAVTA